MKRLLAAMARAVRPSDRAPSRATPRRRVWRPAAWTEPVTIPSAPAESGSAVGAGLTLFHDSPGAEITVAQRAGAAGERPWALDLSIGRFDGTYLSLVADSPGWFVAGLKPTDIVTADIALGPGAAPPLHARLNLRHGPNHARIARPVVSADAAARAEFDLAAAGLDHHRIEALWLDLILESAGGRAVTVLDLALSSHPRAPF